MGKNRRQRSISSDTDSYHICTGCCHHHRIPFRALPSGKFHHHALAGTCRTGTAGILPDCCPWLGIGTQEMGVRHAGKLSSSTGNTSQLLSVSALPTKYPPPNQHRTGKAKTAVTSPSQPPTTFITSETKLPATPANRLPSTCSNNTSMYSGAFSGIWRKQTLHGRQSASCPFSLAICHYPRRRLHPRHPPHCRIQPLPAYRADVSSPTLTAPIAACCATSF